MIYVRLQVDLRHINVVLKHMMEMQEHVKQLEDFSLIMERMHVVSVVVLLVVIMQKIYVAFVIMIQQMTIFV
jgi:hypothetical protein